jgi:glutamate dehydrogenase
VTSSSLEVLAALALDDVEFSNNMAVTDLAAPPTFFKEYVEEIQRRIAKDADLEFECIWREHKRTGMPRYLLTDAVSEKINNLNRFVTASTLWDNKPLRDIVLVDAIPKKLLALKSLDDVLKRVPEAYTKAIFASYLASRYVYQVCSFILFIYFTYALCTNCMLVCL